MFSLNLRTSRHLVAMATPRSCWHLRRRLLRLEPLEDRRLLATIWRNPIDAIDVDQNGYVVPVDALQVINDLNANGPHTLPATKDPAQPYLDTSGDQFISPIDALLVINYLNDGAGQQRKLQEGSTLTRETDVTIGVGQAQGTRTYRVQITATFDTSDQAAAVEDLLAVYLVEPQSPHTTILDRGTPGTALFTLAGTRAEFVPGRVRWDGSVLEIDLTDLAPRDTALLKFQLLGSDGDSTSRVTIVPLTNEVDPEGAQGFDLPPAEPPLTAGTALNLASLDPVADGRLLVENVRFNSTTGKYLADVRLQNDGHALGRDVAIVFPGLPPGVTLQNPSGTTADGSPYLNFYPAIGNGGLGQGMRSDPVQLEMDDPSSVLFGLRPQILASTNHPPVLDLIGPLSVMPGGALVVALHANDPDGDPVTFAINGMPNLPTGTLQADGTLKFWPKVDQLGTYQFEIIADDGTLKTTQPVTLNVVADPITTTRVSGRVLQVDGQPLANVSVQLGAVQGLTGQDGSFSLDLGSGPVVSDTLKIRGELVPGALKFPFIAEKLPLVLEHPVYEGVNNVIARPIYLPILDTAHGRQIDPQLDTIVTTPVLPDVSVLVRAGTLMNQQGTPFAGVLSITEVPIDRTPLALPDNLIPDLVVTIQPGEMVFATPAPMTFPNRSGWSPGTLMDLWSINPVTGQFDDVGDMQVSQDGQRIETISGGVRNSSWHFASTQPQNSLDETPAAECACEVPADFLSDVGLLSGTHLVTYELPTYQSQGLARGVSLRYDSRRANPVGSIQFSYDVVTGPISAAPPPGVLNRIAAQVTLSRENTQVVVPAGSLGFGTLGDTHYWSVGQLTVGQRVGAGLSFPTDSFPTGLIDYDLSSGFLRSSGGSTSGTMTSLRGKLINVNEAASPFGAGWGIAGLQRLVENDDGSLLLVDGDGSELVFGAPQTVGGAQYVSPIGDFSTLTRQPDATFVRRLTNGTTYEFSADGQLLAVRDRNGNETDYEYDAGGRIARITDPVGLATVFTYSGGRIESITTPDQRVTTLTVDSSGNLAQALGPDGAQESWSYDGRHLLVAAVDPRNSRSETTYDRSSRVVSGVDPLGVELTFHAMQSRGDAYSTRTGDLLIPPPADADFHRQATLIQRSGNAETYEIGLGGRVTSLRDSMGLRFTVARDIDQQVTRYTDARGDAFDYSYDDRGHLTESRDYVPDAPHDTTTGGTSSDGLPFSGRQHVVGSDPRSSVLSDVNRDGHIDILTANYQGDNVSLLLGDGFGGFAEALNLAVGDGPISIAVGDVDGDGWFDLVTGNVISANVSLLINDGLGGFLPAVSLAAGEHPYAVALDDLNDDHQLDLIATNSPGNSVSVLSGDGHGDFGLPVGYLTEADPRSVATGDLNGDGHLDLVTANFSSNSVSLLLGDASGEFADAIHFSAGANPISLAVADLNGDGHNDVMTANSQGNRVSVMLGDGGGNLLEAVAFSTGIGPTCLTLGDLNGDSVFDVVTANPDSQNLSVLLGVGDGSFAAARIFEAGDNSPYSVALADLNLDGRLDLVTTTRRFTSSAFVFLGNGDGEFVSPARLEVNRFPSEVALSDMDDDGWLDIVVQANHTVSVLRGNGRGGFATAVNFAANSALGALALGDLNGDGWMDVVLAEAEFAFGYVVSVMLNDGSGGLGPPMRFSVGIAPNSIALGDLNGDNSLDLVIGNGNSKDASVLINDGTAHFASAVQYPLGGAPGNIVLVDLNGDNWLDLVTTVSLLDKVVVRLGNGSGGFLAVSTFATGDGPVSVALADLNGDGWLDAVTGNGNSHDLSILWGDGLGGFAAPVSYATYSLSPRVALHDVNDDGELDILTSNYDTDTVSVLLGSGDGNFAAAVSFATNDQPVSFAVGDLDDDGRPDIVTANSPSRPYGTISVLLSGTQRVPSAGIVRQRTAYDPTFAQPTMRIDGRGNVTTWDIDPQNGNVRTLLRADGHSISYTYVASGQVDTKTDELGHVTDYDYDAAGHLIRVTAALGTPDAAVTEYEFDLSGNVAAVIDGNQHRTEFVYDARNRRTLVRDPLGNETQYTYDLAGNVTAVLDAGGRVTQTQYDARNQLIRSTDPENHVTDFAYDRQGNQIRTTDPLGNSTHYRYDLRGRERESIDPDGGRTQSRYDRDDNRISLTDPDGNQTRFIYDGRDRLVKEVDPLGNAIRYAYDAADNLAKKTDRDDRITKYAYDSLNRVVSETWQADGNVVMFGYDALNLVSVQDDFSHLAFTYDARNQRTSVDNAGTPDAPHVVLDYQYDLAGNVTSVTDTINGAPGATTLYSYDAANRVTRLTQSGVAVADKRVDLFYNPLGQIATIGRYGSLAGGLPSYQSTYAYDESSRLGSLRHFRAEVGSFGTSTRYVPIAFYDLDYDVAGRITQAREPLAEETTDYGYDRRSQLTIANYSANGLTDESYAYDANGNRVATHVSGSQYLVGPGNRLLSDGQFTFEYDGEGNLTSQTNIASGTIRQFIWDHRNRLVQVIDRNASNAEVQHVRYTYDPLNRRIAKSVSNSDGTTSTHFVYDREDVILDFVDPDGPIDPAPMVLDRRYLHGPAVDQIFAEEDGAGVLRWDLPDQLGTIRDLVDNTGGGTQHFVYDAYGNDVSPEALDRATRYGFTGRELDVETGLYYFRARYYASNQGRFLTEDPLRFEAGTTNLQEYVGNAPVQYVDPTGLFSWYQVIAGIGVTALAFPLLAATVLAGAPAVAIGGAAVTLGFLGSFLFADAETIRYVESSLSELRQFEAQLFASAYHDVVRAYNLCTGQGVKQKLDRHNEETLGKVLDGEPQAPVIVVP